MTAADARLRVRYAETDQMGIVYYANYFVWMELGASNGAVPPESGTATWRSRMAFSWRLRTLSAGIFSPPDMTMKL